MSTTQRAPSFVEHLGYLCGRTLPESTHAWVLNDLVGPGAVRRYTVRGIVPLLPLISLFLLLPGELWVRLSMMMLLFIPYVYFLIALGTVYRRHRLHSHGLDPDLVNQQSQARRDLERDEYERRFGR